MSVVGLVGQPFSCGCIPKKPSSFRSRRVRLFATRAALVQARPTIVPAVRDGSSSGSDSALVIKKGDRTDDLQAEARALARSANASVYSPELLSLKYGSRPIKVFHFFLKNLQFHQVISY
jgi:aarF domain-containing kinase